MPSTETKSLPLATLEAAPPAALHQESLGANSGDDPIAAFRPRPQSAALCLRVTACLRSDSESEGANHEITPCARNPWRILALFLSLGCGVNRRRRDPRGAGPAAGSTHAAGIAQDSAGPRTWQSRGVRRRQGGRYQAGQGAVLGYAGGE